MKGCSRFLASASLLFFVISAVVALLLVNIRTYLLSPETYVQVLDEAGVYDDLPAIAADQLRFSLTADPCPEDPSFCEDGGALADPEAGQDGPPGYFANLPEGAWEEVLSKLIDPAWLESQFESALEQVFSILTGEPAADAIVISLVELQNRVNGEAGYQAVLSVIEAQPDCTPEQIQTLSQIVMSGGMSDAMLNCRPPEDVLSLAEPLIRSGLSRVVKTLPSSIRIEIPAEFGLAGSGVTTVISVIRASFLYAPWIALFWLLAVTVFAVRNVRSWLGWWGSGLFMIGFTALLFGLAFDPFLGWGVNRLVISQAQSGFSPGTMEMAINVLHRIVAGFSKPFLAQAGVILGVGLIMLMFRLFTGPRSKGEIGTKLTEPRSQI